MVERAVYGDADVDATRLRDRRVAVIGYGNQGRAQALNLRDSGVQVAVGLRQSSAQWQVAQADELEVLILLPTLCVWLILSCCLCPTK